MSVLTYELRNDHPCRSPTIISANNNNIIINFQWNNDPSYRKKI